MRFYGAICDIKRFIRDNAGGFITCGVVAVITAAIAITAGVRLDCVNDYFEQKGGIFIVWVRGDCGASKYALMTAIESAGIFAFVFACSYSDFTVRFGFAAVVYRVYTRAFSLTVVAICSGIKSVLFVVADVAFLLAQLIIICFCAVLCLASDQRLKYGLACADEITRFALYSFSAYVIVVCAETLVLSPLILVLF